MAHRRYGGGLRLVKEVATAKARVWVKIFRLILLALLIALITLTYLLFKPIPTTIEPISPRASTQYWDMNGGYKVAYTRVEGEAGEGVEKPPVIFLHGGPGGYIHSSVIDVLNPLAARGHDIYLYDQSGTGLSDRRANPNDTTISMHLSDLKEITDRIGAKSYILVGHSFGGYLATLFAVDNAALVDGLILSAPAAIEPQLFDSDGNWENLAAYSHLNSHQFIDDAERYVDDTSGASMPLRAKASLVLAQLFNIKLAPDSEVDAALNTMASTFTRSMVCDEANRLPEEGGGGAYMRMGTNFFPDHLDGVRSRMTKATFPVLVLQGQCDFIPFEAAYEYVDLFPNSRYQYLEGAGHIIYWDKPDAYLAAITEFISDDPKQQASVAQPTLTRTETDGRITN